MVNSNDRSNLIGDFVIAAMIGVSIHGLIVYAMRWNSTLNPSPAISHSLWSLPLYATYSLTRALIAYGLSLIFTLTIGYLAAKNKKAERILLPLLDIGQSIPVLGFLPGLVLGLISIFPGSNFGLELACILMIFTGQVWNMAFGFYASIKAIPSQYDELRRIAQLSGPQNFLNIELPFSASNLAWNSMMSMAGGWFFLTVCEAFTLKGQTFRLPGLGSFMAQAIETGDTHAMLGGIAAMLVVIVGMDMLIWRPIVWWTSRYRVDEQEDGSEFAPYIALLFQHSHLLYLRNQTRGFLKRLHLRQHPWLRKLPLKSSDIAAISVTFKSIFRSKLVKYSAILFVVTMLFWTTWRLKYLSEMLSVLTFADVRTIGLGTAATFIRVILALFMSTLWMVPFGIWIGLSPKRTRFFQPIAQAAASFPAPMLYPIALAILGWAHVGLGIGSTVLILLGVQWYILFNVLAGATNISQTLRETFKLLRASRWSTWTKLYIPSIFPSLVTGWVTAAGGAWNASIVAEYLQYKSETVSTVGLGALINHATATGNFSLLAGSLVAMIIVVVGFNRTVWRAIYQIATTRYRSES